MMVVPCDTPGSQIGTSLKRSRKMGEGHSSKPRGALSSRHWRKMESAPKENKWPSLAEGQRHMGGSCRPEAELADGSSHKTRLELKPTNKLAALGAEQWRVDDDDDVLESPGRLGGRQHVAGEAWELERSDVDGCEETVGDDSDDDAEKMMPC